MKGKVLVYVLFGIIILALMWFFIDEIEKARRKDLIIDILSKENEQLKQGYLSLLEKYLKTQEKVSPDIIEELKKLKSKIDNLDTEVHVELESVIKKVNNGDCINAVMDLAKIVEHKLKEKALKDESFKKKPMLHNLLEHAVNCNWINQRQYENGLLLKDVRNKYAHELAVNEESRSIGISIFAGIDLIYTIV